MSDRIPLRVMCVDDHAFVLEGLRSRLAGEPDFRFVGAGKSLERIAEAIDELKPDVLLVDVEVPGPDVFDVIRQLKRSHESLRMVVLSAHVRDGYIDSAMESGAHGYLDKGADPSEIIGALRRLSGEAFVCSPAVAPRVQALRADGDGNATKHGSRLKLLTTREQQILRMIGQGRSRVEIATAIHRSAKTVDAHRASIMEKLGIHDRVELARYAIREGLVEV